MAIQFRPVDKSNYLACTELRVDENQSRFVAPNTFSLVQAAYEDDMVPLAIYQDDTMVGFILYDFDYELASWSMSRFMIDRKHQGKGLGKSALQAFLSLFFQKHGVNKLYTSVEVENAPAIALYEQYGFKRGVIFEYDAGGNHYREMQMLLEQ